MTKRLPYAEQSRDHLLRAVRLARLPGVLRKQACERFALSRSMLRRAIQELGTEATPTREDLVLHAFTDAGTVTEGPLPDLAVVAVYLDYVNKDASTPDEIRGLLNDLVEGGRLTLEGDHWHLVGAFP